MTLNKKLKRLCEPNSVTAQHPPNTEDRHTKVLQQIGVHNPSVGFIRAGVMLCRCRKYLNNWLNTSVETERTEENNSTFAKAKPRRTGAELCSIRRTPAATEAPPAFAQLVMSSIVVMVQPSERLSHLFRRMERHLYDSATINIYMGVRCQQ